MEAVVEDDVLALQLPLDADLACRLLRDPQHLGVRLFGSGRGVDPDHAPAFVLEDEARDHPSLCRAGDRAHDHGVEEDPEFSFLFGDLCGPTREAEPAERMIGGAGRDRIRLPARVLDLAKRLFPRALEADPEVRLDEPHVCAQHAGEKDVADAVVSHVRPVDP